MYDTAAKSDWESLTRKRLGNRNIQTIHKYKKDRSKDTSLKPLKQELISLLIRRLIEIFLK